MSGLAIFLWGFGGVLAVIGVIMVLVAVSIDPKEDNDGARYAVAIVGLLVLLIALLVFGVNTAGTNAAVHGVSIKDIGKGEYKIVYLNTTLQKDAVDLIVLVPTEGNGTGPGTIPKYYELSTKWLRGEIPQNPYELVVNQVGRWGYYEILPPPQQ